LSSINVGGDTAIPKERGEFYRIVCRLRSSINTVRSKIIVACEGAPGKSASHLKEYLKEAKLKEPLIFDNIYFLMSVNRNDGLGKSPGITKTKPVSFKYEELVSNLMLSGNMSFSSDLTIHISDNDMPPVNDVVEGKRRLEDMIYNYNKEYDANGNLVRVSSKGGPNNDMLSSLETAFYWMGEYMTSARFHEERIASGFFSQ
jgi:hypothetical protein